MFLHGPWGLTWGPFLDSLAERFTVYAPEHPGHDARRAGRHPEVDSLWDLVLCYDELLEQLGLAEAMFVGHSFGAMVACEVAASRPSRVRRLVLIDPIGLWRDDAPVVNWMLLSPQVFPGHVFRDPDGRGGEGAVRDSRGSRGGGARADEPHVGHGGDGQVHLADPGQGAQEAHPPHRALRRC